jgi:hypothetical protein
MKNPAERIASTFKVMAPYFNERASRLFAAAEASHLGRGGVALLSQITGLPMEEIRRAQREIAMRKRREGGPKSSGP